MKPTIYLKDYEPFAYLITQVELAFYLQAEATRVRSRVHYQRRLTMPSDAPLLLDGQNLTLISLQIDGQPVAADRWHQTEQQLRIDGLPERFTLDIETQIDPQNNHALEGLYRSSGNYCTQCEAEGFRRITYYPDRPDVMACFDVYIEADADENPVMLSNGHRIASGQLSNGRHWARWQDPHPKPCYLFALVAGNLQCVKDEWLTTSGRRVALEIYTQAHHLAHCDHAMQSLKRALAWDEKRFALECDLDLYMIVAVDDFNMGAMENKGLNIFNSKLVFASPEIATDQDYLAIESVIGHEYFHNWTGNRITCRDWFQLSLKEGLTVFRDQEFTADLHDRHVKRIEDVRLLRSHQFAEDASPMSHPVRPDSYIEINNFYTVTVYEKGAEVIRLYHTLLGEEGFQRGMRLYIERHDGQAVCTEDFLACMADANNKDLSLMQRWYDQAGTPRLRVTIDYDADQQCCTLHLQQSYTDSDDKRPVPIPIRMGLLNDNGDSLPLTMPDDTESPMERLILFKDAEASFTFKSITSRPIPSLLRGFSAPVILEYEWEEKELNTLWRYDDDPFNRWAAGQQWMTQVLLQQLAGSEATPSALLKAWLHVLHDEQISPALKAEMLALPSAAAIAEHCSAKNPLRIYHISQQLRQHLAQQGNAALLKAYQFAQQQEQQAQQETSAANWRALKNTCLHYLLALSDEPSMALAKAQFDHATNMTDAYAALQALSRHQHALAEEALAAFATRWQDDHHVMNKWLALQASRPLPDALNRVQRLMQHPSFDLRNPNNVRSVLGSFSRNPFFHQHEGYAFMAEQVLQIDQQNPQLASRLVRSLIDWRRMEQDLATPMYQQLERLKQHSSLSPDVDEIVSRAVSNYSAT